MKNSRLLKHLCVLLLLLPCKLALATIMPTEYLGSPTIKEVEQLIDKDTLVLVNIDDTIITPKSDMFRSNSLHRGFIEQIAKRAKEQPYLNDALYTYFATRKVTLVEKDWPEFIEQMKAKTPWVFGFASMNSAVYKALKYPEDWKYKELSKLGVRFTGKVGEKEVFNIKTLDRMQAIFYKGIIFTGPLTKSETLEAFLSLLNTSPSKIVIFETRPSDIEQLERKFASMRFDLYIVKYLGVDLIEGKPDLELIKFQQQYLINQNKWLEDEQARQMMRASEQTTGGQ